MAGKRRDLGLAREIKKEFLKQHLDSITELARQWTLQLGAPPPFSPQRGSFGWEQPYQPPLERDPDQKHMLKYHLRSRALWRHHAEWERKLAAVPEPAEAVRQAAGAWHRAQSAGRDWQYSDDYLGTALWKAFEAARGQRPDRLYDLDPLDRGATYGAYLIERSAATSQERSAIAAEHWDTIQAIASLGEMKVLSRLWGEVLRIEEQMVDIATRAVRSYDILYPCGFCRHLWK